MKKIPTVCIIDDDPMHVYLTKHCIEVSSLVEKVYTFKNGKEAYDGLCGFIKQNIDLPHIIFLDINMPIWDGWQFIEEFSKIVDCNKVPIYVLTSSNSEFDKEKADRNGLSAHFLIKPISQKELKEVLLKHI